MEVTIRKFEKKDILKKIEWINDPKVNRFLHYELPLEYEKTLSWYERIKDRDDRYDAVVEVDGVPAGLIGLLSIDKAKGTAEFYISMGEPSCSGKGIALKATCLVLDHAFTHLGLKWISSYTETENYAAQRLFTRVGFVLDELLENDVLSHGKYVDRYFYFLSRSAYLGIFDETRITSLDSFCGNSLYIKRDDLIPFSFGGNKARKAALFFERIDAGAYDCVVTYGSSSSNHCRVVANMARARGMKCVLIQPLEQSKPTFNSFMSRSLFDAETVSVPVSEVHDTIENTLKSLKKEGRSPYFIPGGGHGNIGTLAYAGCYEEINAYEKRTDIRFDYIFLASGTGTTQAGLVCGQLLHHDEKQIIGISIARKCPYGRDVVMQSVRDYLPGASADAVEANTHFIDSYVSSGYGVSNEEIDSVIADMLADHGIPLDAVYTGKAFFGMEDYLKTRDIRGKNILFIHTGGTPLFFDHIKEMNI